jgi:hypothetical protein
MIFVNILNKRYQYCNLVHTAIKSIAPSYKNNYKQTTNTIINFNYPSSFYYCYEPITFQGMYLSFIVFRCQWGGNETFHFCWSVGSSRLSYVQPMESSLVYQIQQNRPPSPQWLMMREDSFLEMLWFDDDVSSSNKVKMESKTKKLVKQQSSNIFRDEL